MRLNSLILAVIWLSCTTVHAIITQQDPNAIKVAKVDPRNHYNLPEKVQTPRPQSKNSSSVHRRVPSNAVAAAAAPTSSTGALLCGPHSPCIDGSCCGKDNICGFGDDHCTSGCQSGCTAKSTCGRDSEGGKVKCGMNLCCSYYGWCGATSDYCTTGNSGCQQGFGSCETHAPFQCDASAASASKRTIGYYQGANVYSKDRKCGQVQPSDINTDKYTHLYWAFAEINPTTFEIMPTDPRDEDLYKDFTKLKSAGKLETWISVGGFDFTTFNPRAWTDMVGSIHHRQSFIRSIVAFMEKYGFQGIDLDWEYPVDAKRGGHASDMVNLVQLIADMRSDSVFGHKFGISVTLAPDLWYLQHYDAKGLLASADWLGFMSYDLHGLWDANVTTLGQVVYGQTDLSDIERDMIPLWFDLTPADLNRINVSLRSFNKVFELIILQFGLALYGRGYTLKDPSCNRGDGTCAWTDGSQPGSCTSTLGILSLFEIKALIKDKGLTPVALNDGKGDSMMKQITWDNQWIGYDDEDTIKAKTNFASSRCFGGTMFWSVDLEVGNVDENLQFGHKGYPPTPTTVFPTGGWQTDQCTSPLVTDARNDPELRWKSVDTTDAWNAAVANATDSLASNNNGYLSFPELISNFFNGPEGMNCEQLDARSTCGSFILCNAPAASYMIINSMISISNVS